MKFIHYVRTVALTGILIASASFLQAGSREDLNREVQAAIALLKKTDPSLEKFFKSAHGYAIFPNVGKGAIGIGGAHGKGEVYEKGTLIGRSSLSQITIGVQLGGQQYIEIVFFESLETLRNFKESRTTLSAQVSAVAAAEGVAATANYELGVAVFTLQKNGLMFEASVGGQKFKFFPLD
jgi:lipid-binding SYLF domain-containing protein